MRPRRRPAGRSWRPYGGSGRACTRRRSSRCKPARCSPSRRDRQRRSPSSHVRRIRPDPTMRTNSAWRKPTRRSALAPPAARRRPRPRSPRPRRRQPGTTHQGPSKSTRGALRRLSPGMGHGDDRSGHAVPAVRAQPQAFDARCAQLLAAAVRRDHSASSAALVPVLMWRCANVCRRTSTETRSGGGLGLQSRDGQGVGGERSPGQRGAGVARQTRCRVSEISYMSKFIAQGAQLHRGACAPPASGGGSGVWWLRAAPAGPGCGAAGALSPRRARRGCSCRRVAWLALRG